MNTFVQQEIDSLKKMIATQDTIKIYPFNPNFITDFKGYTLNMSVEEIDRLHEFRKANKFVNSKYEFQKVTQVSDSLLDVIAPHFKFPNWTQERTAHKIPFKSTNNVAKTVGRKKMDLNSVSDKELQSINGIGEKLSARIVKFRDRLGGFLLDEQLYDVYGLDRAVANKALDFYTVINKPSIVKINVNEATVFELSKLVYIQKSTAQRIVNYRNHNGSIDSLRELLNIEGFPTDRFDRITLYLSL